MALNDNAKDSILRTVGYISGLSPVLAEKVGLSNDTFVRFFYNVCVSGVNHMSVSLDGDSDYDLLKKKEREIRSFMRRELKKEFPRVKFDLYKR